MIYFEDAKAIKNPSCCAMHGGSLLFHRSFKKSFANFVNVAVGRPLLLIPSSSLINSINSETVNRSSCSLGRYVDSALLDCFL